MITIMRKASKAMGERWKGVDTAESDVEGARGYEAMHEAFVSYIVIIILLYTSI